MLQSYLSVRPLIRTNLPKMPENLADIHGQIFVIKTTCLITGFIIILSCKLGQASVTLPEILDSKGFTTAPFISSLVLDSKFGLSQGFDTCDADFSDMRHGLYSNERRVDQTNSLAFKWLEKNRVKKFFALLRHTLRV